MKQQGWGRLYCLSVVYGPVFSFNYNTKLNSNRLLEGSTRTCASTLAVLYALAIDTRLCDDHSRARLRVQKQNKGPVIYSVLMLMFILLRFLCSLAKL